MSSIISGVSTVRVHGKFISRDGGKFPLTATRLPGIEGALDLSEKLALRKRLDELAAANLNTLILTAAQAESVLGVAGQAGLHALVEIALERRDLDSAEAARCAMARVGQTVSLLRGYPGLIGFVLDCPDPRAHLTPPVLEALGAGLRALAQTIHESHHGHELIAFERRLTPPLAGTGGDQLSQIFARTLREDFTYVKLARIEPADFGAAISAMHRLAADGPLVIEFGEELPGQVEMVANAFGLGAAGVVAPAMRPAASPGWQNARTLSAGEILPFIDFHGSPLPLPKVTPMVSVVVSARDAESTIAACLDSIARLRYPNYEVIVVEDGSRDRTAAFAGNAAGVERLRVVRERRAGIGAALNAGVRAARGHLVAFTRADCTVDEDWLGLALRVITDGRLDGCTGPIYRPAAGNGIAARAIAALTRPVAPLAGPPGIDAPAGHAPPLDDRNMVVRKASIAAAGGFDPRFIDGGADADLAMRMAAAKMTLGWSPASGVWCDSRTGAGAYYRRRIREGRAAAVVTLKPRARFGADAQMHSRASMKRDRAAALDEGARRRDGARDGIMIRSLATLFSLSGALVQALARHHYTIASAVPPAAGADATGADRASIDHLPIAGNHAHPAHPHR